MNLFKLKKDNKIRGYLKIEDGFIQGSLDCVNWHYVIKQNPAGDLKLLNNQWIEFHNEALPYVCDDKNGDKVFSGDNAIGIVFMEDSPPYQVKGKVKYYKASFCIISNCTYYQINDLLEIELIKENEATEP